jgi:hypothetical protein
MAKKKRPLEAVNSSYTPIPHVILDSEAFISAPKRAKALLFDLLRQHNGYNNGHLHLAVEWLKDRGWTSVDQIQKAKNELLEHQLVIKTRLGGLGMGPDRYALTWVHISNYSGLEISARTYERGLWALYRSTKGKKNRKDQSVPQNCRVPKSGTVASPIAPPHGSLRGVYVDETSPPSGNNECCQLYGKKKHKRIVGKPKSEKTVEGSQEEASAYRRTNAI